MSESIGTIVDALEGINATIEESTVGVSDIAEKTTDMVTKTCENHEKVNATLACTQQLSDMVEQFILE